MSLIPRVGQVVLALLGALCAVISLSVFAAPDPFERDAQVLIASFGTGMGLLVTALAIAGLGSASRWAWFALCLLPLFFASHVLAFGTALPDGIFLLVSVAALAVTRGPVLERSTRSEEPLAAP
jgi:hypothetical protein